MTQEELNEVIARHQHWFDGRKYMRSNLSEAVLSGNWAILRVAVLSGAILSEARNWANLGGASLAMSDWTSIRMEGKADGMD